MKTYSIASAAASALLLAVQTAAAQSVGTRAAQVGDPALLDDVVVTANRTAQPADRVGQSVTVLTDGDILASQAVSVSDLLSRTPGVGQTRNGDVGASTGLRIRGAETDQTVVVIDGVKLNDPSGPGGGFNFGNLLINDISRIEILRGAQSTLWGSQAIGGVVNIVTASPTRPFQASLSAEAGSRGTRYVRGGLGGVTDRATWRLAASRFETDGFSAFDAGNEADGYASLGLSGRLDVRLTKAFSLDVRAVYADATGDIDGFPAPTYAFGDTRETSRTRELVAYAGANLDLLDGRFGNRLAYAYTRTDRLNEDPDQAVTTTTFDARGENRRLEYQGVLLVRDGWVATFGAEREESEFRTLSPSPFDPSPSPATAEVTIDGAYIQLQGEVTEGLTLTVGGRRDDHETFGGKALGQAAAAWSLNEGRTVVRASFGQGFKAPSLFQLYSDFGNLSLSPEEADGWDAGVEHAFAGGSVRLSATYFARETTNQIDFVSCTGTETPTSAPLCFRNGAPRFGYYGNTAVTEADGVELEASLEFGGFSADANYTRTRTENRTAGPNLGKQLARRPENLANLTVGYRWSGGATTSVAVRYVGESFDDPSNARPLAAYTVVDLRAAYPLDDHLELYGRVENLGDEAYETVSGYGAPDRGVFVGVRTRF